MPTQSSEMVEKALSKLGIEFTKAKDSYKLSCPIHGSQQKKCFIYILPDEKIVWKCYTRHCELQYGKNFVGFIAGILNESYKKAEEWLIHNFDIQKIQMSEIEQKKANEIRSLKKTALIENRQFLPINNLLPHLSESTYFKNRKFSKEILTKYSVGKYNTSGTIMCGRNVVPLISEDGSNFIGLSGRTDFEKCPNCGGFHSSETICEVGKHYKKWVHTEQLYLQDYLYNFWAAASFIRDSGKAILVEGPCDVWRLEEAGVKNSLAILGTALPKEKWMKLVEIGTQELVLMFDNDEAGQVLTERILATLSKIFRISCQEYPTADVAEMTVEQVKNLGL